MAPAGRPPIGYEWKDGVGWIRTATGEPYTFETYIADVRKRQRDLERRKYHDESTGTRARRRLRTEREAAAKAREREAAAKARKRHATRQLTLDHLRDNAPQPDSSNYEPGAPASPHGHAQDTGAKLER